MSGRPSSRERGIYDHSYLRLRERSNSASYSGSMSGGSFDGDTFTSHYRGHYNGRYDRDGRAHVEYTYQGDPLSYREDYMNRRGDPFPDRFAVPRPNSSDPNGPWRTRDHSLSSRRSIYDDPLGSRDSRRSFEDRGRDFARRDYDARPGSERFGDDRPGGYSGYSNPHYNDDYRSGASGDYGRSPSPHPAYSNRGSPQPSDLSDIGSRGGGRSIISGYMSSRATYGGSMASGRGPSGRYYQWPDPYLESDRGRSPGPGPSVYPFDGMHYLTAYSGMDGLSRRPYSPRR